jgi:hypothetical protein
MLRGHIPEAKGLDIFDCRPMLAIDAPKPPKGNHFDFEIKFNIGVWRVALQKVPAIQTPLPEIVVPKRRRNPALVAASDDGRPVAPNPNAHLTDPTAPTVSFGQACTTVSVRMSRPAGRPSVTDIGSKVGLTSIAA